MNGELGILNVGAGDTKISFDPSNPAERDRAARMVADMLKLGYMLLVQVGEKDGEPLYQRAKGFDPKTCEYIVAGVSDEKAEGPGEVAEPALKAPSGRTKRAPAVRVPAESTRGVAVARSAGG